MSFLHNKQAKAKEITLIGAILLIIIGIIFLTQSGNDPSGITTWIGIIFLFVGIIALVAMLIKLFK
jgi:uncharacterized membrane protein HdeD (DUF308 family)